MPRLPGPVTLKPERARKAPSCLVIQRFARSLLQSHDSRASIALRHILKQINNLVAGMFERNKVDNVNHQTQQVAIAAEVRFDTGEVAAGQFYIHASRPFAEVLNGASPFVEFEVFGEARRWIAKSTLRDVKLTPVPKPATLLAQASDIESFEPHRVLGVDQNAEWAAVRAAYVALSKTYHPDRYASAELPSEVHDYLAAMARRINLAYTALETKHSTVKTIAQRPAPIYESRPRA